MDVLIEKYGNMFNDIYEDDNLELNSKIDCKSKLSNIPKPSEYRVSTMTMTSDFNCNINLSVVDKYFEKDSKIISMVYGDKPVKSSNMKKKSHRPFFNQATIIVRLDPLKKINIKIFSNGRIQMTGVKKEDEGRYALELILQKLFVTEGKVHLSKLLLTHQIELLKDKLGSIKLPDYYFMFPEKRPKKTAWHKYNFTKEMQEEQDAQIEATKQHDKKVFGKTFNLNINVKELVETKSRDEVEKNINIKRIYEDLLSFYKDMDQDIYAYAIEDKKRIKIMKLDTVLINSDFNINFKIKRNILHSILKDNYQIISRYEPGIYPGVNNKFYWNTNNKGTVCEGKCICKNKCIGKGKGQGEGDCKKITIAAFQSGSIIITGARTLEHIEDAYNFINKVIKDNYEYIRKVDNPFMDLEISQNRPIVKKYTKTSDIIYINKKSLLN